MHLRPFLALLILPLLFGCDPDAPTNIDDLDSDGWTAGRGDCDDNDPALHPEAVDIVCDGIDQDCSGSDRDDLDEDGVSGCEGADPLDCDDEAPDVFPGNTEVCDGVDHDCDGTPDNGLPIFFWWLDADGDGFGAGTVESGCDSTPPSSQHVDAGERDCDDASADVNPEAVEACNGVDDDCDESIDEGMDADADGVTTCGPDFVPGTPDDDCDDADGTNFPGNPEVCDAADNDCDAVLDNGYDADEDGVSGCGPDGAPGTPDDDCDDGDSDNFPGNPEVCDGADNDCDLSSDDGFDGDGDGVTVCGPDGAAGTADDDCDDGQSASFPGNPELCDGLDNDCDGALPGQETDDDGDLYLSCTLVAAAPAPILGGDDCDDNQPAAYPGALEACDGIDTDCVGGVPAGELDADGDGFLACAPFVDLGLGFVGADDCDDSPVDGAACFPGNPELCDLVDNNCNTVVDEGYDLDADGVSTCGPDGATGTADDDCDDGAPEVRPGASELCDLIDNDCDALVDEDDGDFVGADLDGDGASPLACGGLDCDDGDPTLHPDDADLDGESPCDGDCDDFDPSYRTSAPEACDGEDNDCNGLSDDGVVGDADGDGFITVGCGFGGDDCMDTDAHVFPDATYTSGYQKQCLPALRPGFATSWAHGRLNLPSYFLDPQTGMHVLYFRGHHDTAFNQFGYATSANGVNWGAIQGPILSEDPTPGVWDGRKISHPTVVYVPGKTRPYLMAYHAQDDVTANRRIGIATATTATGDGDGTFKRLDMSGFAIDDAVLDVSPAASAVDSEQVINPSLWYDDATGLVHLWYTGRFGSPNQFAIAHASCDATISDCGDATDWVKTDSDSDGDPDVWLEGTDGGWDDDSAQQTYVMEHSDPGGFYGYELEVYYTGAGLSIGALQGDIDDAASWVGSPMNPVLEPSLAPERFDGESTTGRGVRYDSAAAKYHMYYGTSVSLPVDANGQGTDVLWGPRNYSGGASYIGHAINNAPAVAIGSADCAGLSGTVQDNGPDTVELTVYDGSGVALAGLFGDATGNSDPGVQSTTFSAALALGAGSHTLTVVGSDAGGAERSASVSLVCP